jgi:hypothetical protein
VWANESDSAYGVIAQKGSRLSLWTSLTASIIVWNVFMAHLTIEVPEIIAPRLEALSQTSGRSVDEVTLEPLDSFAGSLAARRAVVKTRRAAAKLAGTGYSLAGLGCLDGYSGQTADELLPFEGTEGAPRPRILSALEQAVRVKTAHRRDAM